MIISAATVTLIFSAMVHVLWSPDQQIKLDEKAKTHEKSNKVLSGIGLKVHWQQRNRFLKEN